MESLCGCAAGLRRFIANALRSAADGSGDSSLLSTEFAEYEREFKRYTLENLRTQMPDQDFATELSDDASTLQDKMSQLSELWRTARRVVVFTGAGISTSAGLPDYRGPAGVWTRKIRGESVSEDLELDKGSLQPTKAHTALSRLQQHGRIAYLATTNVDGLHQKAGFPTDSLGELHGNSFVEECSKCERKFERDFVVRTASSLVEHETGRSCELCGGPLRDIVVNFGNTVEHVPSMEAVHDRAWVECLKADLVVVLGSSLSVPTACDLPEECLPPRDEKDDGGRIAIVNRQRTPKDSLAALRIFAPCDDVMEFVEQELLRPTSA